MKLEMLVLTISLVIISPSYFCSPVSALPGVLPGTNNQVNAIAPATPPPVGDGAKNPLEMPGDYGNKAPRKKPHQEVTGNADPTTGNVFPWVPDQAPPEANGGFDRTIVHVFRDTKGGPFAAQKGTRGDITIRADQLSDLEIASINAILNINMENGDQIIDVKATDDQLEAIQRVLYPYTRQYETVFHDGRLWKKLNMDALPADGYAKPGEENLHPTASWFPYLPTVRTMGRFLVLVGVVSASIFMAFAAFALILGQKDAGARITGTAAGLMLLLMGFTIWKIIRENAETQNGTDPKTVNIQRPTTDAVSPTQYSESGVPIMPTKADRRALEKRSKRSGMPVKPLYGADPVSPPPK